MNREPLPSAYNIDRYLHLVYWAKNRYTVDGELTISKGGKLSTYSKIEQAAYKRYLDPEVQLPLPF